MEHCNRTGKYPASGYGRLVRALMLSGLSGLLFCMLSVSAGAVSNVALTKHNLSVSGPGTIVSGSENRICIFCHTPHNASPLTHLWNKEIGTQIYTVYGEPDKHSSTLRTPQPLPQPTGPTRLCLSCHDGTIALGTVVSGANLDLTAPLTASSSTYFGRDLSGHHPVSFHVSRGRRARDRRPGPPYRQTEASRIRAC